MADTTAQAGTHAGADNDEDPPSRKPGLIARLRNLVGRKGGAPATLQQNFEDMILDHEEIAAALTAEELRMLTNIVSIREARVDDVMVPRADIVALELDSDLAAAVSVFHTASHSRLPLYRETTDDIVGMVHIKDLIGWWNDALNGSNSEAVAESDAGVSDARDKVPSLMSMRRSVLYVPPSMPVLDLLLKMQATRTHMAIVIDEYGGTDGLVTSEDLIEEIVGDILDEHEAEGPSMTELADGSIDADAKVEIAVLEDRLGMELASDEDDIDTLGGLVVHLAGRVPQRGELIRHHAGLELEVREADPRRIKRVKIHRRKKSGSKPVV